MEKRYLLILDAGTGAGRCSLFDEGGALIGAAYREWHYQTPCENPEIREFDAGEFWNTFCGLIRELLRKTEIKPEEIAGISSTSQREGIVLLDENGHELYAGPNVDFRGEEEGKLLRKSMGEAVYRAAGHWPSAMTAPSRLLWFQKHRPELYQRIKCLLMISDWILYRFTGTPATEPTNACESLFYDIKNMCWNEALIQALGVSPALFAPVLRPGGLCGTVTKKAALETGLIPGTPVFMGGADTQCAVLGTGGVKKGHTAVVLGTSAPLMTVMDTPLIDPKGRVRTCCYLKPGTWVLDSNARPTGVIYRWFRDTFYHDVPPPPGRSLYQLMDEEAAAVPPGANGVLCFLGPSILNAGNLRDFPGVIAGVTAGYEKELCRRGLFSRAILENIAYAVKGNLKQIIEVTGSTPSEIYVTGGASNAPVQLSILANVLGLPLVVSPCKESTSLGAAVCAAVGAGLYQDIGAAACAMKGRGETLVRPAPETAEVYQTLYPKWKQLYDHFEEYHQLLLSAK